MCSKQNTTSCTYTTELPAGDFGSLEIQQIPIPLFYCERKHTQSRPARGEILLARHNAFKRPSGAGQRCKSVLPIIIVLGQARTPALGLGQDSAGIAWDEPVDLSVCGMLRKTTLACATVNTCGRWLASARHTLLRKEGICSSCKTKSRCSTCCVVVHHLLPDHTRRKRLAPSAPSGTPHKSTPPSATADIGCVLALALRSLLRTGGTCSLRNTTSPRGKRCVVEASPKLHWCCCSGARHNEGTGSPRTPASCSGRRLWLRTPESRTRRQGCTRAISSPADTCGTYAPRPTSRSMLLLSCSESTVRFGIPHQHPQKCCAALHRRTRMKATSSYSQNTRCNSLSSSAPRTSGTRTSSSRRAVTCGTRQCGTWARGAMPRIPHSTCLQS